ncbi:sensor histidine kinase [Pelosinus baikalensis]|uniref:histidine kinase n=1 Tax=Pelosinus baikalensis TaxID=2892015 RepID=A0ABS8HU03_9FIRM|nr:HAMP domain-containing sensor histidine kinase [Pelosinus baikalensis]MCC5466654.1 HAMP domain-containing histidine kinase [Pelosinus baikalensis]
MWSKIKSIALPNSIKLSILYIAISLCILFIISLISVWRVQYILYSQARDDLAISANNVRSYIAEGHSLDEHMLNENILVPNVILRVFDDQNTLLLDNSPYKLSALQLQMKNQEGIHLFENALLSEKVLPDFEVNHTHFYSLKQSVQLNEHSYQLHFLKIIAENDDFLENLSYIMKASSFLGLLILIMLGLFIIRNILRPIRDITEIAKAIEINDLGKRIPISDNNNELHKLAKTFNHMLDRLQMGFEQQQRFAADASHELRTPIAVISGYANMLDRWGKQDPVVLEEGISAIKSEAANMHELIEKLLFLARADQSKQVLDKSNLDIKDLIKEIVQETRLIAPNHCILLIKNDTAVIYADSASIKQMLRIFIENSIKYTPIGGTISIASHRTSTYLAITIQDTGIGISQEHQSKIFDRFYRVDTSRSKLTGGTGLGLSIAQYIAEQHDGVIELISIPGEGTTIRLHLPLSFEKQLTV